MNIADMDNFNSKWMAVHEVYNKQISDAAIALAFQVLSKFEWSDISRALDSHLLDADAGRFPPKPADIAKYITGDPESRPLEAWTKVVTAISRQGPYRTIVFDDSVIMAVVRDLGGWVELCKIDDKELPFKRNEFATRYRGYMLTPPQAWPKLLQGLSPTDSPILIGNQEKAEQVLLTGKKDSGPQMRSVSQLLEHMKV
jgi:hypothetical protein